MRDGGEFGGGGGNPTSALVDPWPSPGIGSYWNATIDFKDKIPSLGQFAWKAFDLAGAGDVPDMWGDALAGDWTEVAEVATACRLLGSYCENVQTRLDIVVGTCRQEWTGTAASAMDSYFLGLGATVASMKAVLDDAADAVDGVAFGVRHAHDAVENFCEAIVDALIGICIALGAMAATGWTGLGAALSAAGLGTAVTFAVVLVNDAVKAISTCIDAADGFMALFPALLSLANDVKVVALPDPYEHRAAD